MRFKYWSKQAESISFWRLSKINFSFFLVAVVKIIRSPELLALYQG